MLLKQVQLRTMSNKKISLLYLVILTAGLLAACSVGKQYQAPKAGPEVSFRNGQAADTASLIKWFELYQDTALQGMIRTALDSNRNLLEAASRIEEARLQTLIIKANLYPRFDYDLRGGGGRAGIDARKVAAGVNGGLINAVGGVFSWEIDTWGKIKSRNRSAIAQWLAVQENRNAIVFSLVAEVASQYFLLRDLDNRLAIAKQTLLTRQENTKIIHERFAKGYVAEIDELLAIQQESIAAASIPAIERQLVKTENALRLLMGKAPGTVSRGYNNFEQQLSPDIPVGLSSQLLERRPDIRTAEKLLNAQFERINVAEANRFPSLTLTGILGFASPQLSTFISGKGFVANGFGELTGPIFNFNQNKNQVAVEKQRTQQAVYQYQQTVLIAFADVDNALANYRSYVQELNERKRQVEAAEKSLKLYRAKYDNGYTSYLEVIVQETNLLDAQFQLSITQQGKLNSVVQLYKALGGGW